AHSLQSIYEKTFFHLLNRLHEHHFQDAVALAGGCAMNSVANGKIYCHTPFKSVYIQSAAGDAGGAIGAAFSVATDQEIGRGPFHMDHAYWGPEFDNDYVGRLLQGERNALAGERCIVRRVDDEGQLVQIVARGIEQGLVTGWFQGRMEWGPRALG